MYVNIHTSLQELATNLLSGTNVFAIWSLEYCNNEVA